MTTINRSPEFRLIDFKITNSVSVSQNGSSKEFVVQMFGKNEKGETASIIAKGFQPFFFVKIGEGWDLNMLKLFEREIFKTLAHAELESNYKSWQMGKRKHLQLMSGQGEEMTLHSVGAVVQSPRSTLSHLIIMHKPLLPSVI